jgi:hypothetical protein
MVLAFLRALCVRGRYRSFTRSSISLHSFETWLFEMPESPIACAISSTRRVDTPPIQALVDSDAKCNPVDSMVPQRKVGFPIPNAGLLLGFQGTNTKTR